MSVWSVCNVSLVSMSCQSGQYVVSVWTVGHVILVSMSSKSVEYGL